MHRVCFYNVVQGERYAAYVPVYLLALRHTYPESGALIECHGPVSEAVRAAIESVRLPRHVVRFIDWQWPRPGDAMWARWAACREEFDAYEYVFIGDIDYLFAPETPNLLERRVAAMGEHCVSNTDKLDAVPEVDRRMTGLHMVRVQPYYDRIRGEAAELERLLRAGSKPDWAWSSYFQQPDNQKALRVMLERSGIGVLPQGFFEYHGIHIGHGRVPGRWDAFLGPAGCPHQRAYVGALWPFLQSEEFQRLIFPCFAGEMGTLMDAKRKHA